MNYSGLLVVRNQDKLGKRRMLGQKGRNEQFKMYDIK